MLPVPTSACPTRRSSDLLAVKTYGVYMAGGDRRTEYGAVANTAMGVLLLAAGAVTGVLSIWGNVPALILLAVLGLIGAGLGRPLPEVSARGCLESAHDRRRPSGLRGGQVHIAGQEDPSLTSRDRKTVVCEKSVAGVGKHEGPRNK